VDLHIAMLASHLLRIVDASRRPLAEPAAKRQQRLSVGALPARPALAAGGACDAPAAARTPPTSAQCEARCWLPFATTLQKTGTPLRIGW
jgi:hypothetical protein